MDLNSKKPNTNESSFTNLRCHPVWTSLKRQWTGLPSYLQNIEFDLDLTVSKALQRIELDYPK